MIRSTILALSAAGAAALAMAPAAEAKTSIHIGIGVPVGTIYVGSPVYYDNDCHYVKVKHFKKKHGKLKVWYSKQLVCY